MENGKVYCIRNSVDDDVYVGSTKSSLHKRMIQHKCDIKRLAHSMLYQKMAQHGFDKFSIELLEEVSYDDKQELRNREGIYIKQLGTLNNQIAGKTQKERSNEWKEKNREHYLQLRRDNRAKNRDAANEKEREYQRKRREAKLILKNR